LDAPEGGFRGGGLAISDNEFAVIESIHKTAKKPVKFERGQNQYFFVGINFWTRQSAGSPVARIKLLIGNSQILR